MTREVVNAHQEDLQEAMDEAGSVEEGDRREEVSEQVFSIKIREAVKKEDQEDQ